MACLSQFTGRMRQWFARVRQPDIFSPRAVVRRLISLPNRFIVKLTVAARRIRGYIHLAFLRHASSLITDTLREGMRSILGRPLVLPAICTFLGSNVAFFLPLPTGIAVGVFLLLLFISISQTNLVPDRLRQRAMIILVTSVILFLYTFSSIASARVVSSTILASQDEAQTGFSSYDEFDGTIRSMRISASGYRTCVIRLDQGADVLFGTSEIWPDENMRVGVLGVIGPVSGASNPGSFDRKDYYARQGVYAELTSHSGKVMPLSSDPPAFSPIRFLRDLGSGLRNLLSNAWEACGGQEDAALLTAMLLGDTSEVDRETKADFRLLNLSHLTAVSGANIAYFLAPAGAALHLSGTSRRARCGILLLFIVSVGFVTGWSPSVSRAIVIAGVHLVSRLVSQRFCPVSSIFAAILVLVFLSPFCAVDIGFCLSASAALSLILMADRSSAFFREIGCPRVLADLLGPVISAHIGMIPWMIVLSGRESIFLIAVNIFAGILAEGISSLGLIVTPIALFGSFVRGTLPLARLAFLPVKGLLFLLRATAEHLSPLGIESFRLRSVHPLLPLSVALGIVLFMLPRSFCRRLLAAFCALLISLSLLMNFTAKEEQPVATVIFFDVGQGDSALVILDNGKSLLIDAGTEASGEYVVLPALDYYGIQQPDLCVLTHLHNDHGGGYMALVKDQRLQAIFTPYVESAGELRDVFQEMEISDIAINLAVKDDRIVLSELASIQVLGPSEITENGGNQDSAILLLSVAQTRFLFMGDAGFREENQLLDAWHSGQIPDLSIDILKVGHHGSRYSSGADFLLTMDPDVSVVSVGDNGYGHPSKEATDNILSSGSTLYRTDQDGAVIINVYTDRYEIITYSQE